MILSNYVIRFKFGQKYFVVQSHCIIAYCCIKWCTVCWSFTWTIRSIYSWVILLLLRLTALWHKPVCTVLTSVAFFNNPTLLNFRRQDYCYPAWCFAHVSENRLSSSSCWYQPWLARDQMFSYWAKDVHPLPTAILLPAANVGHAIVWQKCTTYINSLWECESLYPRIKWRFAMHCTQWLITHSFTNI